jgi:hypothetical protein
VKYKDTFGDTSKLPLPGLANPPSKLSNIPPSTLLFKDQANQEPGNPSKSSHQQNKDKNTGPSGTDGSSSATSIANAAQPSLQANSSDTLQMLHTVLTNPPSKSSTITSPILCKDQDSTSAANTACAVSINPEPKISDTTSSTSHRNDISIKSIEATIPVSTSPHSKSVESTFDTESDKSTAGQLSSSTDKDNALPRTSPTLPVSRLSVVTSDSSKLPQICQDPNKADAPGSISTLTPFLTSAPVLQDISTPAPSLRPPLSEERKTLQEEISDTSILASTEQPGILSCSPSGNVASSNRQRSLLNSKEKSSDAMVMNGLKNIPVGEADLLADLKTRPATMSKTCEERADAEIKVKPDSLTNHGVNS